MGKRTQTKVTITFISQEGSDECEVTMTPDPAMDMDLMQLVMTDTRAAIEQAGIATVSMYQWYYSMIQDLQKQEQTQNAVLPPKQDPPEPSMN